MSSTQFNERDFLSHFHRTSYQSLRHAMIIGTVIFDLHVFWDPIRCPENYMSVWLFRLLVVTPLAFLMYFLVSQDYGKHRIKGSTLLWAVIGTSSVMFIHSQSFELALSENVSGVMFAIFFGHFGMRLLVRESLLYAASTTFLFASIQLASGATSKLWIANMFSITVSHIIGVSIAVIMERYARNAYLNELEILHEKARADHLLFKTFPAKIADRLIAGESQIADSFKQVTVLFADLAGFTQTSSKLNPEDLVHQLNIIFSTFDHLTEELGCEKVKTIGDAYMVVAGAPEPSEDHAERIFKLALAMKAAEYNLNLNDQKISVKIGIHTGPVVAGIIGQNRFAYDLWGDTVNTASRMESTARPKSIQISACTYALIKDKFNLRQSHSVEVKGKGIMDTWVIDDQDALSDTIIKKSA